jgi:GxxExxY protein
VGRLYDDPLKQQIANYQKFKIYVYSLFRKLEIGFNKMIARHAENNAETGRRKGAGLFDESLIENKISASIIDAAIEVHRVLGGPGLLESIYEDALAYELEYRKIPIKRQLPVPVIYKGIPIRDALKLDLLVDDRVIVEIKATENLLKVHSAQLLTYLRLTQRKLGLVLNFGQPLLCDGITRVVNNF